MAKGKVNKMKVGARMVYNLETVALTKDGK